MNAIQTVQALVDALADAETFIMVAVPMYARDRSEGPQVLARIRPTLSNARTLLAQLQAGGAARPQTWDRDDIEAVISCLGDDAAQLRDENPEDERADNMDRAASMLTVFAMREHAAAPAVAQPGWKLVPIGLTPEMEAADPYGMGYGRLHAIWSRLLKAAPAAPTAAKNGLTLPEGANDA
jgi:hypothetical protein